jgi:nucleoside-diphosphate-sugar epimerase
MKYLVTGASGFLGSHLCSHFNQKNIDYVATYRNPTDRPNAYITGDLTTFDDWNDILKNVDVVIHSAAKAHDMSNSDDLKSLYKKINLDLTLKIANAAKKNGTKKFIFISTIKVNGELTYLTPFTADDQPHPNDDYGISKYLAEKGLLQLHENGVFDVVIIRPCLIYGKMVKANFNSLIKLVDSRLPLPFGAINNKRSLVSIDNLIDLIYTVSQNPKASGQIFLVSDDVDLSLTQLIKKIAASRNKTSLLIPIPQIVLKYLLKLIGKSDAATKLFSNLQVDISKTKQLLGWSPPFKIEESLQKMR